MIAGPKKTLMNFSKKKKMKLNMPKKITWIRYIGAGIVNIQIVTCIFKFASAVPTGIK